MRDHDPVPIRAAAERLRGHLVATPVLGDPLLPGLAPHPRLRLKLECLQVGGSVWYRGARHWWLRQLGGCKGVVVTGREDQVQAAAAAVGGRVPCHGIVAGPITAAGEARLAALGLILVRVPTPQAAAEAQRALQSRHGFARLPEPAGDPVVAAGIATLGLELAVELAAAVEQVFVNDPVVAGLVQAGLLAGGHAARVVAAPPGSAGETVAQALLAGLRLGLSAAEAASVAAALAAGEHEVCAVTGA